MPRKSSSNGNASNVRENLKPGEILTDLTGRKWMIGKPIGVGGFGDIYSATDVINQEVKDDSPYVAKIECHSSGPLFVEINCYLRVGKLELIEQWKEQHKLPNLGMPHYVTSGSHTHNGSKCRFLILPRYEKDLETVLQTKKKFNLKTVLTVSMQIIDILEYIHSKGYVHSDIKASNIMLGRTQKKKSSLTRPVSCNRNCNPMRKCKGRPRAATPTRRSKRLVNNIYYLDDVPNFSAIEELMEWETIQNEEEKVEKKDIDQVYLLDYGLASKYLTSNNTHKPFCVDERKAHAGTILFCSRDAHKGVQARRSDLECLGYNMIYWLCGYLPWMDDTEDPDLVGKKKQRCMENISEFLKRCFSDYPKFLLDFFKYLEKLEFEEKPDYAFCKKLFRNALNDYGYKNNGKLDFDNLEGWGDKQKKVRKNKVKRKKQLSARTLTRFSLISNFSVKSPKLLRKKLNKKALACLDWSKILIDPEIIIKKQKKLRERKLTESSDSNNSPQSILNMDIYELNPTYAMIEVFNRSQERLNCTSGNNSPAHKSDCETTNIEGYTPAMMAVLARIKERQLMEEENDDDYYYTFPTKKRGPKKKTGMKRKAASTAVLCSPPKIRVTKLNKSVVSAKRGGYRLRG